MSASSDWMLLNLTEKVVHENAFEQKKKKPGLSANRPFDNWALLDKKADESVLAKISRKIRI